MRWTYGSTIRTMEKERPRRMPGEGSIYQRKDGRWVAQESIGGRTNRHFRKRIRLTERKAKAALRDLLADRDRGLNPTKVTVSSFLTGWVRNVRNIRPRTRIEYANAIRLHIVPLIGSQRLSALSPLHVEQMLGALDRARLAPKTQRNVLAVLRRGLSFALRSGLVSRNVAGREYVDAPRVPRIEPRALSADEVHRLLAAVRGDWLEGLIVTAVGTGLRQGELLGLAWEDVDLGAFNAGAREGREVWGHRERRGRREPIAPQAAMDEDGDNGLGPFVRRGKSAVSLEVDAVRTNSRWQGVVVRESAPTAEGSARIHVRRGLRRIPGPTRKTGRYVRDEPKTDRSRRTVPLAPSVVAALAAHRERLKAAGFVPTATGPVFPSMRGKPLSSGWVTHRFYALCEVASIPRAPFKALRATFASRLFEAGVPERRVADLLGHAPASRITTTHYIGAAADWEPALAAVEELVG
jgi:integrase